MSPTPGSGAGSGAVPGAGAVRAEDAFDVERVAAWLRSAAADPRGLNGIPEVRQFTGGVSNLTYLLRYAERDVILRRPPVGTKAKGAHDMVREHDLQVALAPVFPPVPTMVALCRDEDVLGAPFYVMERVVGTILRTDIPPELGLSRGDVERLCRGAVQTLVQLHDVDVTMAGLAHLGRGDGYVGRQVAGWSARYRAARTPDVGSFEPVMAWLEASQPADVGRVLVHNDFRFDNLVLAEGDSTRIVGVLDWELATVGDPLLDLGSALAYWVQADDDPVFQAFRRQPTNADGMLTRSEVVSTYLQARGLVLPAVGWAFYEVFGLFRLAVIAQQVYYRFFHGQTTNPAFGSFQAAVNHLERRCTTILER